MADVADCDSVCTGSTPVLGIWRCAGVGQSGRTANTKSARAQAFESLHLR